MGESLESVPMSPAECESRALDCAAKAARSASPPVAADYLMLAAQWRAMAMHQMYFCQKEPRTFA